LHPGCVEAHFLQDGAVGASLLALGSLGLVSPLEEAVEDDEVVVLGDEAAEAVVFFEEADEFFGGPVVGQSFGGLALCLEELLEDFLLGVGSTLPMPVRWQLSWT
jgi:hypothetical protein